VEIGEAAPHDAADDAAIQLAYASRVIIVPGYGLAVAQAQYGVRELADLLESSAEAYLNAAGAADPSVQIATPNGLVVGPSTMAALLLGEQLIHGLDISRTADIPWTIAAAG